MRRIAVLAPADQGVRYIHPEEPEHGTTGG